MQKLIRVKLLIILCRIFPSFMGTTAVKLRQRSKKYGGSGHAENLNKRITDGLVVLDLSCLSSTHLHDISVKKAELTKLGRLY